LRSSLVAGIRKSLEVQQVHRHGRVQAAHHDVGEVRHKVRVRVLAGQRRPVQKGLLGGKAMTSGYIAPGIYVSQTFQGLKFCPAMSHSELMLIMLLTKLLPQHVFHFEDGEVFMTMVEGVNTGATYGWYNHRFHMISERQL